MQVIAGIIYSFLGTFKHPPWPGISAFHNLCGFSTDAQEAQKSPFL